MLGLLTNIGLPELTVIAAVCVLVFGRRLPQVASNAYREIVKLRHGLEKLRRESGIDRELRDIEYSVRDAARQAEVQATLTPPAEPRAAHGETPPEGDEEAEGPRAEEPRSFAPEPPPRPPQEQPEPPEDALDERREPTG